jgi:hypothetical protein
MASKMKERESEKIHVDERERGREEGGEGERGNMREC